MTRTARLESESKMYHVVTKGAGGQILFETDHDRWFFLRRLEEYGGEEGVTLYAWCLMTNHVHLVLKAEIANLSRFMLRLKTSYVRVFNERYSRTGALFKRQFWSDPILTDERLLATVRYVHQNPLKPGLSSTCGAYRWSSYQEYVGEPTITNTEIVLSMLGDGQLFEDFHRQFDDPASFLDIDRGRRRLTLEEAMVRAHEILGTCSVSNIANLPKGDRNGAIALLKSGGISCRQIVALTGIGYGVVAKV